MFKPFEFCIPTKGITVPSGPEYLHEIKYDGYRLRVERNGDRVRLITRGGSRLQARQARGSRGGKQERIRLVPKRRNKHCETHRKR